MVNGFVFILHFSSLDDHSKHFTVQFYIHPVTHSASISSTLLFYEAQFGVQHLAQGHFGMQIFLGRLGIELPTFRLEDDHSTPSADHACMHAQSVQIRDPAIEESACRRGLTTCQTPCLTTDVVSRKDHLDLS